MVVEDDLISRKWLQRFLGKWGYDVTSYSDGEAAWSALESGERPELILADWMMPRMDGVDLCRNIRSDPRTRHAYVIILTARSEKTDLISGLEAGADDYLVKPVDPDELKTRLRVGERTLSLRNQLAERVRQLESMLRRHEILGEAYTRSFLSDSDQDDQATPGVPGHDLDRVGALLGYCFEQMGWTRRIGVTVGDEAHDNALTMTSALVFPDAGTWIDLAFRVPETSAAWWFESMMGRPPADRREVSDGLIEAVSILQSALRSAIGAAGQVAYVPFHPSPSVVPAGTAESAGKRLAFEAGKARLLVTLTENELEAVTKKLGALSETDVLGENAVFQSADECLSARSGSTPTAEWLARVASADKHEQGREVRVLAKKPPVALTATRLFDSEALLRNTEGDSDLCEEIVRCFLSEDNTAFDRVCDAVERGDWSSALEVAHSLKGSVSYFSLDVSREIARVESAAEHHDTAAIREIAPNVREMMALLVGELNSFLKSASVPETRAS
jgi:CheY-like chemotaxis protein/HPt (histidine-containing phosphotransfer) domain-containing protein